MVYCVSQATLQAGVEPAALSSSNETKAPIVGGQNPKKRGRPVGSSKTALQARSLQRVAKTAGIAATEEDQVNELSDADEPDPKKVPLLRNFAMFLNNAVCDQAKLASVPLRVCLLPGFCVISLLTIVCAFIVSFLR